MLIPQIYYDYSQMTAKKMIFKSRLANEIHIYGSNCLPSISVESYDELIKKLKDKELCFPLTQIKDNWVAEFIDSEGNHIEITAPVK